MIYDCVFSSSCENPHRRQTEWSEYWGASALAQESRRNVLPPRTAVKFTELRQLLGEFEILYDRVIFALASADDASNIAVAEADCNIAKPEETWTTSALLFWENCEDDQAFLTRRVEIMDFVHITVWDCVCALGHFFSLVEAYHGPGHDDDDFAKLKKLAIKFRAFTDDFEKTYREEKKQLADLKAER